MILQKFVLNRHEFTSKTLAEEYAVINDELFISTMLTIFILLIDI